MRFLILLAFACCTWSVVSGGELDHTWRVDSITRGGVPDPDFIEVTESTPDGDVVCRLSQIVIDGRDLAFELVDPTSRFGHSLRTRCRRRGGNKLDLQLLGKTRGVTYRVSGEVLVLGIAEGEDAPRRFDAKDVTVIRCRRID